MTKEEATSWIRDLGVTLMDGESFSITSETVESLSIAISALENIDRITAERDAAIRDLHSSENKHEGCGFCKYYNITQTNHCTRENKAISCDTLNNDMWEWRGVQNET